MDLYEAHQKVKQNVCGVVHVQTSQKNAECVSGRIHVDDCDIEVRAVLGITDNIAMFVTDKTYNICDLETGSISVVDRDVLLKRFGRM